MAVGALSGAKHLLFLVENNKKPIPRFAQDDGRMDNILIHANLVIRAMDRCNCRERLVPS